MSIGITIKQLTTNVFVVALIALSMVALSPAPKASAACSWNKYQITWGQVGIRELPASTSQIMAYGYYGQIYYGPHGGVLTNYTKIQYNVGGNYAYGYIPNGSRVYLGCF